MKYKIVLICTLFSLVSCTYRDNRCKEFLDKQMCYTYIELEQNCATMSKMENIDTCKDKANEWLANQITAIK